MNSGKITQATGIEGQVCRDIARRQRKGISKYGMTVAQNPAELRAWLVHAYEETLDKGVYLRKAIAKLDQILKKPGKGKGNKCGALPRRRHEKL